MHLHLFDGELFKEMLAAKVTEKTTDAAGEEVETWALNDDTDADYEQQLAAEHKVLKRDGRRQPRERWIPVTAGAANHYLDCEVMQLALAHVARVDLLTDKPRSSKPFERVRIIGKPIRTY